MSIDPSHESGLTEPHRQPIRQNTPAFPAINACFRQGWDAKYADMVIKGDDQLLDGSTPTE